MLTIEIVEVDNHIQLQWFAKLGILPLLQLRAIIEAGVTARAKTIVKCTDMLERNKAEWDKSKTVKF